jgi:hypothetical protein
MNSSSMLYLSVESGNIIIKPIYSNYEDVKNINCSDNDDNIDFSFENKYEDLIFENINTSIESENNVNLDNKKSKLFLRKILKENWEEEIQNIKYNLYDKYLMDRFPF